MPADKYLKKVIKCDDELDREGWKSGAMRIDPDTKRVSIEMKGYLDGQTIANHKPSTTKKAYVIEDYTTLDNYEALYTEIVAKMITDEESEWYGATLEDVPPGQS